MISAGQATLMCLTGQRKTALSFPAGGFGGVHWTKQMLDEGWLVLAAGALAIGQAVFGYFYARNYREQREFRQWVYQHVHGLDLRLARNCALTEVIHERVKEST